MRLLGSREIVTELLVALHWSERLRRLYNRTLRDHERCGSPPVPMTSRDYGKEWRRQRRQQRRWK